MTRKWTKQRHEKFRATMAAKRREEPATPAQRPKVIRRNARVTNGDQDLARRVEESLVHMQNGYDALLGRGAAEVLDNLDDAYQHFLRARRALLRK